MASSLFDMSGRVCFLTGATKGIGRAVANAFVEHGARIAVTSRNRLEAEQAAQEINSRAGRRAALGLAADLTDVAGCLAAYDEASAKLAPVDVLVCNAAALPSYFGLAQDAPADELARMLTGNVVDNAALIHHAARAMQAHRDGVIIVTGSASGSRPSAGVLPYAVSKAALAYLVRCLALEFAPHNVRINCVAPGLTRSYSSEKHFAADPGALARALADIPLHRMAEAEEIAAAMVFLASAGGKIMTGATLLMDGGEPVKGMSTRSD